MFWIGFLLVVGGACGLLTILVVSCTAWLAYHMLRDVITGHAVDDEVTDLGNYAA